MSVFATRTKPGHLRTLVGLIGLCAIVAGGVYASRELYAPLTAALRDVVALESAPPTEPTETVFPNSQEVDWEGVVFGIFGSGDGFAVRRTGTGELFQAYFADGRTASVSSGPVRIRGRLTGISCAYRQTVFNGKCTPTVDINELEILPIVLE